MACSSTAHGTVAITNAGGVILTPKTINHTTGSVVQRTAGLVINNDGTANWRKTFTFAQYEPFTDWLIPNASGAAYEVRITNLNWNTMDEGFTVTPSSVIGSDHTTLTFSGSTITRTGGTSFITLGFTAGSTIRIDRTNLNEGNYTIATGGVASSVITVDESFTAEGPIVCNLTQGGWLGSSTQSVGGDPNGDEDTWYSLDVPREWSFIDVGGSGTGVGLQDATFDMQIRKGSTILATAAMDWAVDSITGGGGPPGGGCFEQGTEFMMADGSLKEVQDIAFGDYMAVGGEVSQTVTGNGKKERWFDINGVHVTGTHTICKDGEWMRVRAAGYPEIDAIDQYYVVVNENHRMVAANGQVFGDYEETDHLTTEFGDWMIDVMNGKVDASEAGRLVAKL